MKWKLICHCVLKIKISSFFFMRFDKKIFVIFCVIPIFCQSKLTVHQSFTFLKSMREEKKRKMCYLCDDKRCEVNHRLQKNILQAKIFHFFCGFFPWEWFEFLISETWKDLATFFERKNTNVKKTFFFLLFFFWEFIFVFCFLEKSKLN